jgi:hypothetical protein
MGKEKKKGEKKKEEKKQKRIPYHLIVFISGFRI